MNGQSGREVRPPPAGWAEAGVTKVSVYARALGTRERPGAAGVAGRDAVFPAPPTSLHPGGRCSGPLSTGPGLPRKDPRGVPQLSQVKKLHFREICKKTPPTALQGPRGKRSPDSPARPRPVVTQEGQQGGPLTPWGWPPPAKPPDTVLPGMPGGPISPRRPAPGVPGSPLAPRSPGRETHISVGATPEEGRDGAPACRRREAHTMSPSAENHTRPHAHRLGAPIPTHTLAHMLAGLGHPPPPCSNTTLTPPPSPGPTPPASSLRTSWTRLWGSHRTQDAGCDPRVRWHRSA